MVKSKDGSNELLANFSQKLTKKKGYSPKTITL